MELENIIEICVAIDIAILGIAYPIIVDKISNIGDKYSSQYIAELFDNEFPQKSLKIKIRNRVFLFSIFKSTLYITIICFTFLILNLKPLFGWNNWFINNSAKLTVLATTLLLTIFFFVWLDKVVLFNGRSTFLLKRIIRKYKILKSSTELKAYHLKSINEITFYAIDKQDEHLQQTLLEFYSREFFKIRKEHNKSLPLVYPIDLYFLISKLNTELVSKDNKKLLAIEHRAVSGVWLLGEDFEHIIISDETYSWLWRNLYIICDNGKFVKMYWANASQYFDYRLQDLRKDLDFETATVKNEEAVKFRREERERFLEHHYALGGLLLYRNQYKTIKYIFDYTQSQPPKYPLLPETMTEIFFWFEYFRNEFKAKGLPVDSKYSFPELDNLGNQRQIIFWICSYMSLLFVRQYSLNTYYVYQNFTALPQLPEDVIELNNWLDSVSYFKLCLDNLLENTTLKTDLRLSEVVDANRGDFYIFLEKLKAAIIEKIGQQKLQASLSDQKVENFKISTNEIISMAFLNYDDVLNSSFEDKKDTDLMISITGGQTLMTKSAFTEDDIPHLNYNTVVAEQIAEYNIKRFIPNSFYSSATRRYLLNKHNLLSGLEIIISDLQAVIIAINANFELRHQLDNSKFTEIVRYIPSSQYQSQNTLFILSNLDLPSIEHRDLTTEEKEEFNLSLINDSLKLYASVIDLNLPGNEKLKDKWAQTSGSDNEDLKVQITISFLSIIYWRKDRDVVQINIASEFKEQGVQSNINEIEALKNPKDGNANN